MKNQIDKFAELDAMICEFLANSDGHATNSSRLCDFAAGLTHGQAWRLVDRRMQLMRKSGRIRFVGRGRGNPSGRSHGWVVIPGQE